MEGSVEAMEAVGSLMIFFRRPLGDGGAKASTLAAAMQVLPLEILAW